MTRGWSVKEPAAVPVPSRYLEVKFNAEPLKDALPSVNVPADVLPENTSFKSVKVCGIDEKVIDATLVVNVWVSINS
jgi:hypothetical protein